MSDLTRIEQNNAELRECIEIAESLPDAGGGGGELPTLFAPTIALVNGATEINITDKNGDFVEKYEVYIDGVKSGEVSSREFAIADITASNKTIEIFVKAIANLFNASETSNIVVKYVSEGTEGLEYTLLSNTGTYSVKGIGVATDTEIYIPKQYQGIAVTHIATRAFEGNRSITKFICSENITSLGQYCCNACSKLTEVYLNAGITDISSYAFYRTSIASVVIPSTLKQINECVFAECKLEEIIINNGTQWLMNKCFYGNTNLKGIALPKSIRGIYSSAFENCTSLEYLDLTAYESGTALPTLNATSAFNGCSSAFEIRVPSGRKAELAAMTNWSNFADNIVEV